MGRDHVLQGILTVFPARSLCYGVLQPVQHTSKTLKLAAMSSVITAPKQGSCTTCFTRPFDWDTYQSSYLSEMHRPKSLGQKRLIKNLHSDAEGSRYLSATPIGSLPKSTTPHSLSSGPLVCSPLQPGSNKVTLGR